MYLDLYFKSATGIVTSYLLPRKFDEDGNLIDKIHKRNLMKKGILLIKAIRECVKRILQDLQDP